MKRRVLIICFTVSLLVATVFAHPGGTDGSGGHRNSSTGDYHYHHGYSAHDHYDMDGDGDLDCPYDFDDKTDHSNSNNSLEGKDSSSSIVQSKKTKWEEILLKAFLIFVVLITVPIVVFFSCAMITPINFIIGKLSSFAQNEEKAYITVMRIIIVSLQLYFTYKIITLK